MDTWVYIDGFNFYYGAVKNTRFKWLDLNALCKRVFPKNNITKIKYFTAKVKGTPRDPNKPKKQETYIRALRATDPNIDIIYGYFLKKTTWMPLASGAGPVEVLKMEEKGSDVNLAVHLVNDAWKGSFQAAIVVSDDSDLVEAIRIVGSEHNLPVGILNPQMKRQKRMAAGLSRVASFRGHLTVTDLKLSQLPNCIPGTTLCKPSDW